MMHLPTVLSLIPLTFSISKAEAYWKGFNVGANLPGSGACKSTGDWASDFRTMASLPGHFTSARLFASSDCNTLLNTVPAALATGTTLLPGVWTEDTAHFEAEKAALLAAVQQYGHDWIIAVGVGSEDLYRGDTDPNLLAAQIYDVRGMLASVGAHVQVGHVDTWTAWVNRTNDNVTLACDFVGMDGYPYFQGATVEQAPTVFWDSYWDTRGVVDVVSPGTWVWITETGHPVSGADFGNSHPSIENAQSYWKSVACSVFQQAHAFWFILSEWSSSPDFGVVGQDGMAYYDLSC